MRELDRSGRFGICLTRLTVMGGPFKLDLGSRDMEGVSGGVISWLGRRVGSVMAGNVTVVTVGGGD